MPSSDSATSRHRKTLLTVLGVVLMAAGVFVFFLQRLILPLRIAMGFVDLIAGATLLVFVRQQFGPPPPPRRTR